MSRVSNKFYVVSFTILFGISTAILLIASTTKTPLPAWGGYLDVGIVVLIAFCGFAILSEIKVRRVMKSFIRLLFIFSQLFLGARGYIEIRFTSTSFCRVWHGGFIFL